MATKPLAAETAQDAVDAVSRYGSLTAAADALGIPRQTLQSRIKIADRDGVTRRDPHFEVPDLPSEALPTPELVKHRKSKYERLHEAKQARKLIDVTIKLDGPIGIAHFGDPHVDDDGCDIGRLETDMQTVKATPGMFGANVGDLQNNWVGRIAHLWAQQSTSAREAWQLVEWMVHYLDWIYMVGGNHDAWSGNGDPLDWIMRQQPGVFGYNGTRLNLCFPNGKQVRVNARHDFVGHSMWNPAHGPMKAVQGGWRDHILTCGHKHTSFIGGPLKDPSSGILSWAIRIGGYKIHDRYADEKGLPDQNAFSSCVTVIDPRYDDDDTRLVTVIPSVQEGAAFVKWKRGRK